MQRCHRYHYRNVPWLPGFFCFWLSLSMAAAIPVLNVPLWPGTITVDGQFNESCYKTPPLVDQFLVAGQPEQRPQKTQAWLFWQPERLIFAFECDDTKIVAAPPSAREHDVDAQDRVEIFLWSGRTNDPYACIEISARGALHDYLARFYRQFNDAWSMTGLEFAVHETPRGYRVEGTLSSAALESLSFHLRPGEHWRVGLFRADFPSHNPQGEPTWITWVDAHGPQPDFHVAESFGEVLLMPAKK